MQTLIRSWILLSFVTALLGGCGSSTSSGFSDPSGNSVDPAALGVDVPQFKAAVGDPIKTGAGIGGGGH